MKVLRWIISLTAIAIVFAIVYFWTAKRTLMAETRDFRIPSGA